MSYEKFKRFSQRNLLYTYSAGGGGGAAVPAASLNTPLLLLANLKFVTFVRTLAKVVTISLDKKVKLGFHSQKIC